MPPVPAAFIDHARSIAESLVAWRRHLHAHPELSGQEVNTARFVAQELRRIGYTPVENVGGTHGVIADLDVGGDRPRVALRADMDALPITEQTELPFASQSPGVMHACGHDAHTAMLLGAAKVLHDNRDQLAAPVRFIFQPHEEMIPGGAADMIAGGALDGVARIFGIHIWSQLPAGRFATRPGPMMAAVNDFDITITGRGGHAAMPEVCVDPVVVAAQLVTALQTIASRTLGFGDAAVVSVTRIEAGTAYNVIPPLAKLAGTVRTFDETVRKRALQRIRELTAGVCAAFGAEGMVEIEAGYPVVINDADETERARAAATAAGIPAEEIGTVEPIGGGEDFAYYQQKLPGVFVFVGGGNEAKGCIWPHHHPRFDIDESALPRGVALHCEYARLAGRA